MTARSWLCWASALLVGLVSLALALVSLPPAKRPLPVDRLWPSHPAMLAERAMTQVGIAAGRGEAIPAAALRDLDRLAVAAPLSPDPYLVKGTIADAAGQGAVARALLTSARLRDPRSTAARYLLALRDLQDGRTADALSEMTALGRLMPSAKTPLIEAMAAYARQPGAAIRLRSLVRNDPEVEQRLLATLAQDPANANLILSIAGPGVHNRPDQSWPTELVDRLVRTGDIQRARLVWNQLSGEALRDLVFHPDFAPSPAPPPFNWAILNASGAALAERRAAGGLDIVYYGRDAAVIASQLLVLGPGRYRLQAEHSAAQTAGSLGWALTCQSAGAPLFLLPLANGNPSETVSFDVPAGCAAQRLELRATPGEVASQVSLTLHRVNIVRAAS